MTFKEEKLKEFDQEIEDFILTFAMQEDDGTYSGHDTNLGDCAEEKQLHKNFLSRALDEQKARILELVDRIDPARNPNPNYWGLGLREEIKDL